MKNFIFLTVFLFSSLFANGKDYLKDASDCFDKGDYQCAISNYLLFNGLVGSQDINGLMKKARECLNLIKLANNYFQDNKFENARDGYKAVLDKNPKDPNAKRQYNLCVAKIGAASSEKPASTVAAPVNSSSDEQSDENAENPVSTVTPDNNRFADYTESVINLQMVAVQGGTFIMGCTSEQGNDCLDSEKPAHQVVMSDFYMGKYEVTQAQWESLMGNNPSQFKGANQPVVNINYDEVWAFIRKLNAQTGKQYHLPTEAEWEYAARGGAKSQGYKYSGSNNPDDVAWYADNGGSTTHPVGGKNGNELGIYDMSGNAWEWCNDWYGDYSGAAQTNPQGVSSGTTLVCRGGGWISDAQGVRVARRYYNSPDNRNFGIGFRLACSSK